MWKTKYILDCFISNSYAKKVDYVIINVELSSNILIKEHFFNNDNENQIICKIPLIFILDLPSPEVLSLRNNRRIYIYPTINRFISNKRLQSKELHEKNLKQIFSKKNNYLN